MIKSKRIWLFQMPILDEMKMTDRAAEIEVQQILAQGNNAQQNRVTFNPLRQIFAKILPAAQRHGQGLGCNVVLLLLWGRLAFGLTFRTFFGLPVCSEFPKHLKAQGPHHNLQILSVII